MSIADVKPPTDPNESDTFNSLRDAARQHAAAAAANPNPMLRAHNDLLKQFNQHCYESRGALDSLAGKKPSNQADAEALQKDKDRLAEKVRAYSELAGALDSTCGGSCRQGRETSNA